HLNHATARDAFEKLYAQAHLSLETLSNQALDRVGQASVTLDMTDQPFLVALMEVCRQTRVEPDLGGRRGYPLSAVRPSKPGSTPSWVDFPGLVVGPFLFVPKRIYMASGFTCRLDIVGMIDPCVGSHETPNVLIIDAAEDDKGCSLLPDVPLGLDTSP